MRVNLIIGQGKYEEIRAAVELFREQVKDMPVSCHLFSPGNDYNHMSIHCDHTRITNVTNIAIESLPDTCKQDVR